MERRGGSSNLTRRCAPNYRSINLNNPCGRGEKGALSTTLDKTPRKTLEERATDAAANVLHLCHTLEGMRDDFIPLLPKLKDETVIAVRMGARAVSVWAWVI